MELNVKFKTIDCCSCGFLFAIPESVLREWRDSHVTFHCPSCNVSQHFTAESDAEKYKKQMRQYKASYEDKLNCCVELKEEVQHQKHRINGYKGALVKAKVSKK
jgi:hypothetical protein